MYYFYKQMSGWVDTTYWESAPEVMEARGWVRCTKGEYDSFRSQNAADNRKRKR